MNKKILIANQIRMFGLHISSMPVLKFFKPYKLFDKIAERLGYFQYQSALLSLAKALSEKDVNYQELIQDVEIVPTKEKITQEITTGFIWDRIEPKYTRIEYRVIRKKNLRIFSTNPFLLIGNQGDLAAHIEREIRKVKGLEFADIEFKKTDSRKAYYRIFEKFNIKPLAEF